MWFSKIRGGVHPDGFKELSAEHDIEVLAVPPTLYVPLRQHAGKEAVPIVKAGDKVLKGQLIARADSGLSAPVHAPTSGTIADIRPVVAAHPSGFESRSIIIDSDGLDEWQPREPWVNPWQEETAILAQRIADAGIVGMGGAAFPSAVKLSSASRATVETVIINGGECEPYLTADDRLMVERAADIVQGAHLIRYIVDATRVVIAIEDNKPQAITMMRNACKGYDFIHVQEIPSRYPMGSAKQMIQAVTGKEVPAGGRSSDLGVVMHNVATAYAIARCLLHGEPLISRIVTVSGGAIAKPRNLEVLIGTPIEQLMNACGGTTEVPERLILGGPMMGNVMPSAEVPVIKGAAGVLALQKKEITKPAESPCIRCGRCVNACPMGLVPLEMANHSRQQDFEGAESFGLKDCILCGSCAYVCPSHIPLVHYFQYARGELSKQTSDANRVAHTKELADARRLRIEQEAAAKAAAKAAKAAKRKRPKKTAATSEAES